MKTTKDSTIAVLITHGGIFHADELLATVIAVRFLRTLGIHPKDILVARVNKVPDKLANNAIVFDIGGGEFDHHQEGRNGKRQNGIHFASCGLVWKAFAPAILAGIPNSEAIAEELDKVLLQGVDGVDNGDFKNRDSYERSMSINEVLKGFNPNWDSSESSDECFEKAYVIAETIFENTLEQIISKYRAQEKISNAIENCIANILVLECFLPWKDVLTKSHKEIDFIIYPSNRGGFNISITGKYEIPYKLRGKKVQELVRETGIKTLTFVHPGGFIAATGTQEDAIAFAKKIMEMNK